MRIELTAVITVYEINVLKVILFINTFAKFGPRPKVRLFLNECSLLVSLCQSILIIININSNDKSDELQ